MRQKQTGSSVFLFSLFYFCSTFCQQGSTVARRGPEQDHISQHILSFHALAFLLSQWWSWWAALKMRQMRSNRALAPRLQTQALLTPLHQADYISPFFNTLNHGGVNPAVSFKIRVRPGAVQETLKRPGKSKVCAHGTIGLKIKKPLAKVMALSHL